MEQCNPQRSGLVSFAPWFLISASACSKIWSGETENQRPSLLSSRRVFPESRVTHVLRSLYYLPLKLGTTVLEIQHQQSQLTRSRCIGKKWIETHELKVQLPCWKSYTLRYVFTTRRKNLIIMELLSRVRNPKLGQLNFSVTQSAMGYPSITKPYQSTVHNVLAPAVFIGAVNVL